MHRQPVVAHPQIDKPVHDTYLPGVRTKMRRSSANPARSPEALCRCPECGTPKLNACARLPRSPHTLTKRWLPVLAAAVVLFGFLYRAGRSRAVTPASLYKSEYTHTISASELALAEHSTGAPNVRAILEANPELRTDPRRCTLHLTWGIGRRALVISRFDGWPYTVRSVSAVGTTSAIPFTDLDALGRSLPDPFDPAFVRTLLWNPGAEMAVRQVVSSPPTGPRLSPPSSPFVVSSAWYEWNILAPIPLVVLAALIVRVLWRVTSHSRQLRLALVMAACVLVFVAFAVLHRWPRRLIMPSANFAHYTNAPERWSETTISHRDLLAWADRSDGDASLVRAIIATIGTPPTPDAVAQLNLVPSGTALGPSISYGWPVPWVALSRTRVSGDLFIPNVKFKPDGTPILFPSPRWPTPGFTVTPSSVGWVNLHLPVAQTDPTRLTLSFSLVSVLTIASLVIVAYSLVWTMCYAPAAIRASRWHRHGRCHHCGYDLAPPAPPATNT